MSLVESILIIAAVSLNIVLIAEYEGANLRKLDFRKVLLIVLIFFLGQQISFGLGYLLTKIPFFQLSISAELKQLCYFIAAIILLGIGVWMIYRTWRKEQVEERLRELQYKRIILEAILAAILTFLSGIACGFLGYRLVSSFITVACATILAVLAGLNLGYSQGNRFRKPGYGVSGLLFVGMGVEILVKYL